MALFILICTLATLAFFSGLDSYHTGKRAEQAWQLAWDQKCRLDRWFKQANIGSKETKYVSYEDGWSPKSSWEDDFSKTQCLDGYIKRSVFRRLADWIKR